MRFACLIAKANNTHSEYVILKSCSRATVATRTRVIYTLHVAFVVLFSSYNSLIVAVWISLLLSSCIKIISTVLVVCLVAWIHRELDFCAERSMWRFPRFLPRMWERLVGYLQHEHNGGEICVWCNNMTLELLGNNDNFVSFGLDCNHIVNLGIKNTWPPR